MKLGSIQNIVMPHRLKSKYLEFAFSWTHISKTLCVDLQKRTVWNIMMRKSEKEILWMWQTHLTCLKTISKNSPYPMLPFLSLSTLLWFKCQGWLLIKESKKSWAFNKSSRQWYKSTKPPNKTSSPYQTRHLSRAAIKTVHPHHLLSHFENM